MTTAEREGPVGIIEDPTELLYGEIFVIPNGPGKTFVSLVPTLADANRISATIRVRDEFANMSVSYSQVAPGLWLVSGEGIKPYRLEDPYRTGSDSDAVYIATGFFEDGILLGQYLGCFSSTSHHRHGLEIFSNTGNLLMHKNETEIVPVNGKVLVKPGESHIEFTADKPAFTFIYRPGGVLDHDPLPRPPMDFLLQEAKKAGHVSEEAYQRFLRLQAA